MSGIRFLALAAIFCIGLAPGTAGQRRRSISILEPPKSPLWLL